MWSLGCLLYELLTGRLLFERGDWTQFYLRATSASQPLLLSRDLEAVGHRESSVTKQLLSILNMCLVRDPMRRPSAAQVLQRVREVRLELKRQLMGAPTSLKPEPPVHGASADRATAALGGVTFVDGRGPEGQEEVGGASVGAQGGGDTGGPVHAGPRLDSVDLLPAADLPVLASQQASPLAGRPPASSQASSAAGEAAAQGSDRRRSPESPSMAGERWGQGVRRVTDAGPNALLLDVEPSVLECFAAALLDAGRASSAETQRGLSRRGVTHLFLLPQSPTTRQLGQVAVCVRDLLDSGPWHVAAVVLPAWGDWHGRRLCRLITQEVAGLDPLSAARAATERRIAAA